MSKTNYWISRIGIEKEDNYVKGFNMLSHLTELSSVDDAVRFDSIEELMKDFISCLNDSGNPEVLDGRVYITHIVPQGKTHEKGE